MKFLLVSPFTSVSGSAVRFWNIAQHIQRQGHTVVYVERRPRHAPKPRLENLTYLTSPKLTNLIFDICVSLVFNLMVFIRHCNCDVYYALKPAPNNCLPALAAKLLGKKLVLDIDDLDFGYLRSGLMRKVSQFYFHYFPRHFDLLTCHTERLRTYIIERLNIPHTRILFLTQGLSDVFVGAEIPRARRDIPKSIVYLATLGITSDFNDILPTFVRLCQHHPDLEIKIIGDGVRRTFFEKKIAALGVGENVHFLQRVEHEHIPRTMADNWIGFNYMRPTTTNNCRAILKLREYLAMGLQVVCNNAGDAYLFRDYVYIEKTIQNMEKRTLKLLARRPPVNIGGRKFVVENFRWEPGIDTLLEKISRLKQ